MLNAVNYRLFSIVSLLLLFTTNINAQEPTASFTVSPNPAACNQTITFNASASYTNDPEKTIVSYEWTFGDLYSGDGVIVTHEYTKFGKYNVLLIASDNGDPPLGGLANIDVDVSLGNNTPISVAGGPYIISLGDGGVYLDGSGSSDPDAGCDAISFLWDLDNDGQYDDGSGAQLAVTFGQMDALGFDYPADPVTGLPANTVKLRVTDRVGATSESTAIVTIYGDSDSDGVHDGIDACFNDPYKVDPGVCGCGIADTNTDSDTIPDCNDIFPDDPDEWLDTDGDGTGNNADTDDDGDSMPDTWESQYPLVLDPLAADGSKDLDYDGYTNLDEYNNGTNPHMPQKHAMVNARLNNTTGLRSDGTAVAVGDNSSGQNNVESWSDIVSVTTGESHTIGLKSDRTVVALGNNDYGQCNVAGWTDIVAVSAGASYTVGIKADGTAVAAGQDSFNKCNVTSWSDIISVTAGKYHTAGIKADGTVVAVGNNIAGQCDTGSWSDIISVSVGDFHTVGARSDGTVTAVGSNSNSQSNVSGWTNIISVSAGSYHTVGLKSDGTVVAVGQNNMGQCNVSGWTDIIAISAGGLHTVGLKSDGTVVAIGYNASEQCNVDEWVLIDDDGDGIPNGWEILYGFNPDDNSDAALDTDFDGLTNLEEYQNSTNPNDPDTDNDEMPDGWETEYSLNPLTNDAAGDVDADGSTNFEEYQNGTNPTAPQIPLAERNALIALYNSTNGDNWTDNSGWKTGDVFSDAGTECSWHGVICNVDGDKVISVFLPGNNLTGSIPQGLTGLTALTELYLDHNQLSGTIPSELSSLLNLTTIHLDTNQISGSIPVGLGSITGLKNLYLDHNQLSGSIPAELGNLSNLETLELTGSLLTGDIPVELSNLNALSTLTLDYNSLHTNDETLRLFLNNLDSDWENTQTIVPINITGAAFTETSVKIQWLPDGDTINPGSYSIYHSTAAGGPYTLLHETEDKNTTQVTITGLDTDITYYFVIRMITDPHMVNQNIVASDYSDEISVTTIFDADGDGMSNDWEISSFGSLAKDGIGDYDSDGLSDLEEYQNETNPTLNDTDSDGIPDGWEVEYGIDPLYNDASLDPDKDGYNNLQEYREGGDPYSSDTPFPWELFYPAFMKKK